jgi:hypothetical protein
MLCSSIRLYRVGRLDLKPLTGLPIRRRSQPHQPMKRNRELQPHPMPLLLRRNRRRLRNPRREHPAQSPLPMRQAKRLSTPARLEPDMVMRTGGTALRFPKYPPFQV